MGTLLRILRWIIVVVAIIEIFFAILSLSTNFAPSIARIIIWPIVGGIALYYESKANKKKNEKS